jgi:hypothetical protein
MFAAVQKLRDVALSALKLYWRISPFESAVLKYVAARRKRQAPTVAPIDALQIIRKLENAGLNYFMIPSSQGNFLRVGIPASEMPIAVETIFTADLSISFPDHNGKNLSEWALATDLNDSFAIDPKSQAYGKRFGDPLKTVSRPLVDELLEKRVFYVHGKNSARVSRADLLRNSAIEFDIWAPVSLRPSYLSSKLWNPVIQEFQPAEATRTRANFRDNELATISDFAQATGNFVLFPIDAVYLWVDGNDSEWQSRRASFQPNSRGKHMDEAAGVYRFRNSNELKYAIRSLHQNAPWIRRVWIVADQQVPDWLIENHQRVTVVNHKDFIPQEYRPTFSSHVISANLHHLKDVSQNFIYLNDDLLFSGPSVPENWFKPNGVARSQVSRNRAPAATSDLGTLVKHARRSTIKALHDHNIPATNLGVGHGPMPWTKKILQEIWKEFPRELDATCLNRFRSENDMVPDWMVSQFGDYLGLVSREDHLSGKYVAMHRRRNWRLINRILFGKRPEHYICLNDGISDNSRRYVHEDILSLRYLALLNNLFPHPSPVEK